MFYKHKGTSDTYRITRKGEYLSEVQKLDKDLKDIPYVVGLLPTKELEKFNAEKLWY